jgi:hypothetical protein
MMFRDLGKGLLARLAAYALFILGFWLLFQAFERPSPALGVLGGALILAAMYSMAKAGVNAGSGRPLFPWPSRDAVPPADGPAGPSLPDAEDREERG